MPYCQKFTQFLLTANFESPMQKSLQKALLVETKRELELQRSELNAASDSQFRTHSLSIVETQLSIVKNALKEEDSPDFIPTVNVNEELAAYFTDPKYLRYVLSDAPKSIQAIEVELMNVLNAKLVVDKENSAIYLASVRGKLSPIIENQNSENSELTRLLDEIVKPKDLIHILIAENMSEELAALVYKLNHAAVKPEHFFNLASTIPARETKRFTYLADAFQLAIQLGNHVGLGLLANYFPKDALTKKAIQQAIYFAAEIGDQDSLSILVAGLNRSISGQASINWAELLKINYPPESLSPYHLLLRHQNLNSTLRTAVLDEKVSKRFLLEVSGRDRTYPLLIATEAGINENLKLLFEAGDKASLTRDDWIEFFKQTDAFGQNVLGYALYQDDFTLLDRILEKMRDTLGDKYSTVLLELLSNSEGKLFERYLEVLAIQSDKATREKLAKLKIDHALVSRMLSSAKEQLDLVTSAAESSEKVALFEKEYQSVVHGLEQKVHQLQEQLEKKEATIVREKPSDSESEVEAENEKLRMQLTAYHAIRSALGEKNKALKALQEELATIKALSSEQKRTLSDKDTQLAQLQKQERQSAESVTRLNSEIRGVSDKLVASQQMMVGKETAIASLRQELSGLTATNARLNEQADKNDKEAQALLARFQTQISDITQQFDHYEKSLAELRDENSKLRVKADSSAFTCRELSAQVGSLKDQLSQGAQEAIMLHTEIKQYNEALEQASLQQAKSAEQLALKEEELNLLRSMIENGDGIVSQENQALFELQREREWFTRQHVEQTSVITWLESELKSVHARLDSSMKSNERLEQRLDELTSENKEMQDAQLKLEALVLQHNESQAALFSTLDVCDRLRANNSLLQDQMHEVESSKARLLSENADLRVEIKRQEKLVEQAQASQKVVELKLSALTSEHERVSNELLSKEAELRKQSIKPENHDVGTQAFPSLEHVHEESEHKELRILSLSHALEENHREITQLQRINTELLARATEGVGQNTVLFSRLQHTNDLLASSSDRNIELTRSLQKIDNERIALIKATLSDRIKKIEKIINEKSTHLNVSALDKKYQKQHDIVFELDKKYVDEANDEISQLIIQLNAKLKKLEELREESRNRSPSPPVIAEHETSSPETGTPPESPKQVTFTGCETVVATKEALTKTGTPVETKDTEKRSQFKSRDVYLYSELFHGSERTSAIDNPVYSLKQIKLEPDQIRQLFQPDGLKLRSSSGQAYLFSFVDDSPRAVLVEDEHEDEKSPERSAITMMNMIDDVLAKGNSVHINTQNTFTAEVARRYIAYLKESQDVVLRADSVACPGETSTQEKAQVKALFDKKLCPQIEKAKDEAPRKQWQQDVHHARFNDFRREVKGITSKEKENDRDGDSEAPKPPSS